MKIKVLLIMPNKEVQIVKIPANIKFIKSFIGEYLFNIKLSDNIFIIANRNAKFDEFNRIVGRNIVLGTFIVVSIKNNHIVSIKKKDIRKYNNMFKLKKHESKIQMYKEEYLEEYYTNQRIIKHKNAERNKREIFNIAA